VEEKSLNERKNTEASGTEIKLPDKTIAALKALGIPLDAIFQAAKAQNERIERLERNQTQIIELLQKKSENVTVENPQAQTQTNQENLVSTLIALLGRNQNPESRFFEQVGKETFFKRIAFGDVMQEAALKAMGKVMYKSYTDRLAELGKLEEEAQKSE